MFTQLRVENFKAWQGEHKIELAPLNLFLGTNSAGKTSLLQMLLLLKQTAESPDRRQHLSLGGQPSDLLDLGGFKDIISAHYIHEKLAFGWRRGKGAEAWAIMLSTQTFYLLASAAHPGSPFGDSDVPPEQQLIVLDWLMAFRADRQRNVVLDRFWKIWKEYRNKMTAQDIGLMVVTEKLHSDSKRIVDISYDKDGHGCLPKKLEKVVHDRADRKLVAVAMGYVARGGQCSIINACDSDWYDWEEALDQAGVVVEQLIDEWCRPKWEKKHKQ